MKLKFSLDSLDGLDENTASLYAESGGKYTLQVEGAVPQSRADELASQLQAAKSEAIDNRKIAGAYKTLGTVEEIQQRLSDAAKGKNPDHERIVADMKSAHEAEIGKLKGSLTDLHKRSARDAVKAALAEVGVLPEGLDLLANAATPQIEIGDDGSVQFKAPDGKPMIGSAPDGSATAKEFAAKLAEGYPILVKDTGKPGGGTPQGQQGGTPGGKTIKASDLASKSPREKAAFFAANPDVTVSET